MIQIPKLPAREYPSLLFAIFRSVITILLTTVGALFRGSTGAPSYKRHVGYAGIRTFLGNLTIRQLQALTPSTVQSYRKWSKKMGFAAHVVDIGKESKGCWIGDSNADIVILWFHGGGYVMMASPAHMKWMWSVVSKARESGKNVSCFLPQYDMAPGATFPRQLSQAVAALQYLTGDVGLPLSQIIIGGDSAGGHLTLALLSHMLHQHASPTVSAITTGKELFRGICLVSPVATFDRTAPAYSVNANRDVLAPLGMKRMTESFLGNTAEDNYTTPLNAPVEWWRGLPGDKVLVLTGKEEVLVDDIQHLVQNLKTCNEGKVGILVGPGECHDAPLIETILRLDPGKQTKKLHEWVLDQIQKEMPTPTNA